LELPIYSQAVAMFHTLANELQRTSTVQINLDKDRLSRLKSELLAIELWDTAYYGLKRHCLSDEVAYQSRQVRREELLRELLHTLGPDARAFHLRFV
jgi:hypothetical protein